jgi:hypothetical protein
MGCRTGITTRPRERKVEWEKQYPELYDWRILGEHPSREEAQEAEDATAAKHGCDSSGGGDDPGEPGATWYHYHFYY